MKGLKIFILFCILLIHFHAKPQGSSHVLENSNDTLQYSLGVFVGNWIAENGFTINNMNLFNQGMADLLLDNPRAVPDSTIVPRINAYQQSIQNQRSVQMEQQLFANLRGQAGVGVLPNGVHYIVTKAANGIRPMLGDSIVFNVVGGFPNGTIFENTFLKDRAIRNTPEYLIPGLNEAVQLMPEGSTWRIFVPSALAYGAAGVTNVIPPNSALVFELTLEEVKQNKVKE